MLQNRGILTTYIMGSRGTLKNKYQEICIVTLDFQYIVGNLKQIRQKISPDVIKERHSSKTRKK